MRLTRSKTLKVALALCLVATLAVGAFGCAPTTPEPKEPWELEWDIPALFMLTGPVGWLGQDMKWAAEFVVNKVNAAGGVKGKPIHLDIHDTAYDADKTLAEATKVVDDALILLGPISDVEHRAIMPLIERKGLYIISCATTKDITDLYHDYLVIVEGDLEVITTKGPRWWARQYPDMERIVTFYDPNVPVWETMDELAVGVFEEEGVGVAARLEVTGTVDYGTLAAKALAYNPDAIYFDTDPTATGQLIKQLALRGFAGGERIMIQSCATGPELFSIAEGYLEGCYIWNSFDPDSTAPLWVEVKDAYEADVGAEANVITFLAYDMTLYLIGCLEQSGVTGDPAKLEEERAMVRTWCHNQKDFHWCQDVADVVDGDKDVTMYIMQVENNKMKFVVIAE